MSKVSLSRILPFAALAVGAGMSTPAQAAGWNGAFAGVSVGGIAGTADAHTSTVYSPTGYFATTSPGAIAPVGEQKLKPGGAVAGIDVGYNFQNNHLVFGVIADVSDVSASHDKVGSAVYPCCTSTSFTVRQTARISSLMTARGRLGYSFGGPKDDANMIYLSAGYAGGRVAYREAFTDNFASATEGASAKKMLGGWTAGVGAEVRLSEHWTMRPEYLYADLGSISVSDTTLKAYTPPIAFPTNTFSHSADVTMSVARIGLDYHY